MSLQMRERGDLRGGDGVGERGMDLGTGWDLEGAWKTLEDVQRRVVG
jgi:hypothetical protein